VTLQQQTLSVRRPDHAAGDAGKRATFGIGLRIPSWAGDAHPVNGIEVPVQAGADGFVQLQRQWQAGDSIAVVLPMQPQLQRAANVNVQESRAPDGSPVAQEVLRWEYAGLTYGPLVYATADRRLQDRRDGEAACR
jgi:DUF1680 family protein